MMRELFGVFGDSAVALTELPEPYETGGMRVIPHYTVKKTTNCPEGYLQSSMNIEITAHPTF